MEKSRRAEQPRVQQRVLRDEPPGHPQQRGRRHRRRRRASVTGSPQPRLGSLDGTEDDAGERDHRQQPPDVVDPGWARRQRVRAPSGTAAPRRPRPRIALNRNTDCQSQTSSSTPETSRPKTAPAPATPTQAPTARPRCSAGNDVVMIDRVVGMTSAAPTPITPRRTISTSGSAVNAAAAEPSAKTASPMTSTGLRPYRSPSAPAGSSSPAKTRA